MKKRLKGLSDEEALQWVEDKAQEIDNGSLDSVIESERILEWKKKKIPHRLRRLQNQVGLAFEMIKDYRHGVYTRTPWLTIAMAAAAILYFLNPLDMIPDVIPVVGMLDDAVVLAAVYSALKSDLLDYCLEKGYEPADYFG